MFSSILPIPRNFRYSITCEIAEFNGRQLMRMKRVFLLAILLVVSIMWPSLAFQRVSFTPRLHPSSGWTPGASSLRQIRKNTVAIKGTGASSTPTRLFGGGRIRDGLGKAKGYSDANSRYILQKHTKSGLPNRDRPFLVLGIESSCDDTGAAIVRSDGTVLSNVVYSQYEIHERFGGIVPSLAMEAHKTNINKAVTEALAQVRTAMTAVTAGRCPVALRAHSALSTSPPQSCS